jgi:hypothetical protein
MSLPLGDVSSEQLNNAYKRDRFECKRKDLLVRSVRIDGQNASKVAERELHKSTWWWA